VPAAFKPTNVVSYEGRRIVTYLSSASVETTCPFHTVFSVVPLVPQSSSISAPWVHGVAYTRPLKPCPHSSVMANENESGQPAGDGGELGVGVGAGGIGLGGADGDAGGDAGGSGLRGIGGDGEGGGGCLGAAGEGDGATSWDSHSASAASLKPLAVMPMKVAQSPAVSSRMYTPPSSLLTRPFHALTMVKPAPSGLSATRSPVVHGETCSLALKPPIHDSYTSQLSSSSHVGEGGGEGGAGGAGGEGGGEGGEGGRAVASTLALM